MEFPWEMWLFPQICDSPQVKKIHPNSKECLKLAGQVSDLVGCDPDSID